MGARKGAFRRDSVEGLVPVLVKVDPAVRARLEAVAEACNLSLAVAFEQFVFKTPAADPGDPNGLPAWAKEASDGQMALPGLTAAAA